MHSLGVPLVNVKDRHIQQLMAVLRARQQQCVVIVDNADGEEVLQQEGRYEMFWRALLCQQSACINVLILTCCSLLPVDLSRRLTAVCEVLPMTRLASAWAIGRATGRLCAHTALPRTCYELSAALARRPSCTRCPVRCQSSGHSAKSGESGRPAAERLNLCENLPPADCAVGDQTCRSHVSSEATQLLQLASSPLIGGLPLAVFMVSSALHHQYDEAPSPGMGTRTDQDHESPGNGTAEAWLRGIAFQDAGSGISRSADAVNMVELTCQQSVRLLSRPAQQLLYICSFLQPDYIPMPLLTQACGRGILPTELDSFLMPGELRVDLSTERSASFVSQQMLKLLCELRTTSLITWTCRSEDGGFLQSRPAASNYHMQQQQTFSMHRITKSAVLKTLRADRNQLNQYLSCTIEMLLLSMMLSPNTHYNMHYIVPHTLQLCYHRDMLIQAEHLSQTLKSSPSACREDSSEAAPDTILRHLCLIYKAINDNQASIRPESLHKLVDTAAFLLQHLPNQYGWARGVFSPAIANEIQIQTCDEFLPGVKLLLQYLDSASAECGKGVLYVLVTGLVIYSTSTYHTHYADTIPRYSGLLRHLVNCIQIPFSRSGDVRASAILAVQWFENAIFYVLTTMALSLAIPLPGYAKGMFEHSDFPRRLSRQCHHVFRCYVHLLAKPHSLDRQHNVLIDVDRWSWDWSVRSQPASRSPKTHRGSCGLDYALLSSTYEVQKVYGDGLSIMALLVPLVLVFLLFVAYGEQRKADICMQRIYSLVAARLDTQHMALADMLNAVATQVYAGWPPKQGAMLKEISTLD
ncbi:uncharacterized protein LOC135808638 [Sycon ciliatum]|uniref:uncharacterized protein LOC135808638 n=1 Tax=Sycon ciliatum TaxID=27933 RepID=UPI0031F612F8